MDIDARDVKKEQEDYEFYEGYLVPYKRVWENPKVTRTRILEKHKSIPNADKIEYCWMQTSDSRKTRYTENQAGLLRFAECIRKRYWRWN